jgi:hypothetical protein
MYDFAPTLPFLLGINLDTIAFILNLGIPLLYFACFAFLFIKLRGFDASAPYHAFIKALVYFFFFYGLGAMYFLWYDFFFMDFTSPNPIAVFEGTLAAPQNEVIHYWKIGILLQNIGLFLMLKELRGRILKGKFQNLPIVWEIIGIAMLVLWGWVPIPNAYYWAEINFLFNFSWSIALPLTYGYIYKNSAGNLAKYAKILYICFLTYGIAWGFRTRFAVHIGILIFSGLDPNPMTYPLIWLIRAVLIDFSLIMVLYAYNRLLKSFD